MKWGEGGKQRVFGGYIGFRVYGLNSLKGGRSRILGFLSGILEELEDSLECARSYLEGQGDLVSRLE